MDKEKLQDRRAQLQDELKKADERIQILNEAMREIVKVRLNIEGALAFADELLAGEDEDAALDEED